MEVKSESEVVQSCPTLATPWTAAYEAPPPMGFSRQKYWSGVPLPSLEIDTTLPNLPLRKLRLTEVMKLTQAQKMYWPGF